MTAQTVQTVLSSPAVASFVTLIVMSVLYQAVGRFGSLLEAQGAARKMPALIVLGKKLEALAYDGPKLAGQQGADESGK